MPRKERKVKPMTDRIAEIKARCEAATAGPWEYKDNGFVEVVRCKDCAVPHNKWTGCPKMNGTIMPPDGYCSYGERRSDNG
jgi:hypothetical protein